MKDTIAIMGFVAICIAVVAFIVAFPIAAIIIFLALLLLKD